MELHSSLIPLADPRHWVHLAPHQVIVSLTVRALRPLKIVGGQVGSLTFHKFILGLIPDVQGWKMAKRFYLGNKGQGIIIVISMFYSFIPATTPTYSSHTFLTKSLFCRLLKRMPIIEPYILATTTYQLLKYTILITGSEVSKHKMHSA